MDWQKEMDELRRREEFAERAGRAGAGEAAARRAGGYTIRERIDAAGRRRQLPRDRARSPGSASYDAQQRPRGAHAVQLRLRAGPGRRPAGGDRRRRLHRARRLGRRHDQGQAQPVRADGQRAAPAADPARRGLGRRRLGQDHRDDGPRQRARRVDGWERVVDNMGTVPRVALGLGSVAGLGAAHLAAAHYSVMVKDKSALFVAGPPVVERLGQKLTKNELGGWQIQLKAGARRRRGRHRRGGLRVRAALPLLPAVLRLRPAAARARRPTIPQRREEWLFDAIPRDPRKPYKMRAIVEAVVDRGSFFEMRPLYGRAVITGLARLDGWPVAMMASDPYLLRRRVDGRHLPEGRALRRHRADLPPADRLSRRLPGLPHRPRGRADGDDQAGRARDVGDLAVDACRGAR